MKGKRGFLSLILGVAVFAGILYSVGFGNTWRAFTGARFGYIGLTLLFFALGSFTRLYKWLLMRDRTEADIGFSEMNGMFFFSKFWGLVSPMRSGEVAPALFDRGDAARRGKLLSIILYDRVLETCQSLIVFVVVFFLLYGKLFDVNAGYALAGITAALALFVFVLLSREAGERVFGMADAALAMFGGRRAARKLRAFLDGVKGSMGEFYAATRSCFTPWFSIYNLSLTFVAWGFDLAFWVVMFKAFSINTELLVTVTSVIVYTMVAAVAPTPNGLGVSDLSFVLILGHFGYSGEVGGVIILSRVLVLGYTFLGYLLFAPKATCKEAA